LRRRRRHSTQLFRSNTNSSTYPQAAGSKKKGLRHYLLYFFLLGVLGLIAYYAYQKYYYPQVVQINKNESVNKTSDPADASAPSSTPGEETTEPPVQKKIQVEILNGCGKEGVAKIFQAYLQEQGFDVLNAENYIENGKKRWNVPASKVISRNGDIGSAQAVAKSLGISAQQVESKPDPNAIYNISVVLGGDYMILKAMTSKNR
jgi:hypothetical protein